MRLVASVLGVGVAVALSAASRQARAFEREWHLGGALGMAGGKGLTLAPALGAYAAYGLSDVFDARLELTARGYHVGSAQNPNALSAMLGITYKLDVLRWVPWAGVYAGYSAFLGAPPSSLPFKRSDAALGFGAGLDYGFSRNWGAGVTVRVDDSLSRAGASSFEALLRAEYRWGW